MRTGILLVNLGSPDSPTPADVRVYLDEFLMDPCVIDLPFPLRYLLVKGIILNVRPKKSAAAYASIWWDSGSPLVSISKQVATKLADCIASPIALAMRYGNPSIESGIAALLDADESIERVVVVPLYPHYAMATTQTVVDHTNRVVQTRYPHLCVTYLPPFYDHPEYIGALADSINAYLCDHHDYLLFSYHGVPIRHLKKTDPTGSHCAKVADCCFVPNPKAHPVCYAHQVKRSTELVAQRLPLRWDQWSWSFQSRLGLDKWLTPATADEIERLARSGTRHLAVCCPAFVSDCLETLEEIGEEGKHIFLDNGGESFTLIPCLNTNEGWIQTLYALVTSHQQ